MQTREQPLRVIHSVENNSYGKQRARFAIRVKQVAEGWILQKLTVTHQHSGRNRYYYDPVPYGEIPNEYWHSFYPSEEEAEKAARATMVWDVNCGHTYSYSRWLNRQPKKKRVG